MSDVLRLLDPVARLAVLLGGLLGPGAALASVLGVPRTVANCFAGSATMLYAIVVGATLTGVPITATTLVAGLAMISGLLALAAVIRTKRNRMVGLPPPPGQDAAHVLWFAPLRRMGAWTPLYAGLLAITVVRAIHEPLAGPDVNFRWTYLPEQMLRYGTLNFYPPRTATDFTRYFWVENIPPGIAALYGWTYACAGKVAAIWTVPVVLIQYWSLHELTWRGALRLGGERAARFACLLLAGTPLLTWSVLLGQETGLTAVSLLGMMVAILEWRHTARPGWAAMAGLFALLGAMAREYGLVFPVLAAIGLALAARPNSTTPGEKTGGFPTAAWIALLVAMVPLSLIWPLRAIILTGNPMYSLPLGSFPTNRCFVSWLDATAAAFGPTIHTASGWGTVARYLTNYAPGAVIGWIALAWVALRRDRGAGFAGVACIVVLELWFASVPYTNGGLFYTMRVMSPALAVGALAAGCALASQPQRRLAALIVGAVAAVALPVALALPANPWTMRWREAPAFASTDATEDPIVAQIRKHGVHGTIAVDAPGYQRLLAPEHIVAVPLWSPVASCLIDPQLTASEAAQHWRASGLRHVILTRNPVNLAYFATYAHWQQPPFRVHLIADSGQHVLLEIDAGP